MAPDQQPHLSPRAARDPGARHRGVRRDRPARRLEEPRRAGRSQRLRLDGSERALGARDARAPHSPAHLCGPSPDGGGLPPVRGRALAHQDARPGSFPLDFSDLRQEVDSALEATSEMLSQVTRLLALVSAPPLESTTVRHVEVLLLNPNTAMVGRDHVNGRRREARRHVRGPRRPRAREVGRRLPQRASRRSPLGREPLRALEDPSLSPAELAFLDALRPAFTDLLQASNASTWAEQPA